MASILSPRCLFKLPPLGLHPIQMEGEKSKAVHTHSFFDHDLKVALWLKSPWPELDHMAMKWKMENVVLYKGAQLKLRCTFIKETMSV